MTIKLPRKFNGIKLNQGMTYVELIVVLSIFAVLTAVVMFNYGSFQGKLDIKTLASDIALRVTQAESESSLGKMPSLDKQALIASPSTWKPSYGLYFDLNTDDKSFIYFVDVDSNHLYAGSLSQCAADCVEKVSLTKGSTISEIRVFLNDSTSAVLAKAHLTFTRPVATLTLVDAGGATINNFSYVQIKLATPAGDTSLVKVYASGRIQVN